MGSLDREAAGPTQVTMPEPALTCTATGPNGETWVPPTGFEPVLPP